MNLTTQYMTRNDCYTVGRKITPKGIMVHSTAAPGVKAAAWFARWNKSYAAGEINRQACVHAFLDDIGVCQYLPWDHRGWHAGGTANNTHIGFEICEPAGFKYAGGATMSGYDVEAQEPYFRKVWDNAVELCTYLCLMYGLTETNIICHSEGRTLGIASNHADVMHWFPKHGESMDTFRAAVKAALAKPDAGSAPEPDEPAGEPVTYTVIKGDSLSKIGKLHGIPWPEIAALNGIGWPYIIHPGQVLIIKEGAPAPILHTVVKGESLYRIGNVYGVPWKQIAAGNGVSGPLYIIHPGQVLTINKE